MQKIIGTILMIVIGLSFNNRIDQADAVKFNNRETVDTLNKASGEVRKISGAIYTIWCQEKYLKLNAYNLPEKFRQPGLLITFSGNIKFTNTLEDEWGELFEVTAISK